jgi:hypothetical protein
MVIFRRTRKAPNTAQEMAVKMAVNAMARVGVIF